MSSFNVFHSVEIEGDNGKYNVFVQRKTVYEGNPGEMKVERIGRQIPVHARKAEAVAVYSDMRKNATFRPTSGLEMAIKGLEKSLGELAVKLEAWGKKFAADPMHALSWSRDAFEHAAQKTVATTLLHYATQPDATLARLQEISISNTIDAARRVPNKSSSQTSNIADDYMTKAWADAAKRLDYLQAYDTDGNKEFADTCTRFGLDPADPMFCKEREFFSSFF